MTVGGRRRHERATTQDGLVSSIVIADDVLPDPPMPIRHRLPS